MNPMLRNLKDEVTYWAPAPVDNFGIATFTSPVLVRARWEDRQQTIVTYEGEEVLSQAEVFVDVDLLTRGYLAQGDKRASADPTVVPGAQIIKSFVKTPDLRRLYNERRAFL